MKVLELSLLAYGHFTGEVLDLSAGDHGLHVILGENEAGKSTALRALEGLLFGIELRSADGFLHDNTKLRIGGRLLAPDGSELKLVRRKGNKNTLLSAGDGTALPDDVLDPLLNGLDVTLFRTLFGLDHERLVSGGKELLQERGVAGRSLFTAATGLPSLRKLQQTLDEELNSLYTARARKAELNEAVVACTAANRRIQEASLDADRFRQLEQELERLAREIAIRSETLERLDAERSRLERVSHTLPLLASLHAARSQRDALAGLPELPSDFAERRRRAIADRDEATGEGRRRRDEIERVEAELSTLTISDALLARGNVIELLVEKRAIDRKALGDLQHRRSERDLKQRELELLLAGTTLQPETPVLEAALSAAARVDALAREQSGLVEKRNGAREKLRDLGVRSKQLQDELAARPDAALSPELPAVLAMARNAGDLARAMREAEGDLARARETARIARASLGLLPDGADVESVSVPVPQTVADFEQRLGGLDAKRGDLARSLDERAGVLARLEARLSELEAGGAVPSEPDLEAARSTRDHGWQLVKAAWLDGHRDSAAERAFDPERPLHEAYESRVVEADAVGDHLRREAARVAERAQLHSQQAAIRLEVERLTLDRDVARADIDDVQRAWRAAWSGAGVVPRSPREMAEWLRQLAAARERQRAAREAEVARRQVEREVAEHVAALRAALGIDAVEALTLPQLVARAEAAIALANRRKELAETLDGLQRDQARAEGALRELCEALERWETEWAAAVAPLGLSATARAEEAQALLRKASDALLCVKSITDLDRRIRGIDRDHADLVREIGTLVQAVAPELAEVDPHAAIATLADRLKTAREQRVRRDGLRAQLEKARTALSEAEHTLSDAETRLAELRRVACVADDDQLDWVERTVGERRSLVDEIAKHERMLRDGGSGLTLEALEREGGEFESTDSVNARLGTVNRDRADLNAEHLARVDEHGRRKNELQTLRNSSGAAEAAAEAASLIAETRGLAARYLRLKAAHWILARKIERYREENQGPLLKCASAHFERLTDGSFERLGTGYDSKDNPELRAIRGDRSLEIDALSEGTRDQLYLALRMAWIEQHVAKCGPMPVILDDVLVGFDDRRTRAALEAFVALSRSTQVLLFTHHNAVADAARALPGAFVHELSRNATTA